LKKLLILGGSGFIGSSMVDYGINKKLIKNKINKIYILSRSVRFPENKKRHINITYINKNMLDVNKLPQVDYIIYCLKNSNIKISNNYFNQFLKILKNFKKKPKILFTSSGAVYGKNINKRKDIESKKIDNILIDNFVGYKKKYAKEKVFLEEKFKELAKKNYNVSIARCYTFIGKNIIHYDYVISDLINAANNKNKIILNSHIDVFRSYMHSDDLSNWLITILKNSNTKCPIYNVGSDKVINLKSLTEKIGIMTNKKISIKIKKSKKFDYYVPSITKAYKELNLKISINLNDALNSIIKRPNDKN
jgi:nucleoside-diphosphate-sugar epimerase